MPIGKDVGQATLGEAQNAVLALLQAEGQNQVSALDERLRGSQSREKKGQKQARSQR